MSLSPAVSQSQTEDKAMTKRFCSVLSTLFSCLLRERQGNYASDKNVNFPFFIYPDPTPQGFSFRGVKGTKYFGH